MNSSTETVAGGAAAGASSAARGGARKAKTLERSAFYPHPPEKVWVALTDPRALAEWLMPNNFRPGVGVKFRFQTDPQPGCGDGVTECETVEFDPPRRMVWLWTAALKPGRACPPMRIEWTLAPEGEGTRLHFRQSGLENLPLVPRMMMTFGWGTMIKRWLPKVVANAGADGSFAPGAIPLSKRCYKVKTLGGDMVY